MAKNQYLVDKRAREQNILDIGQNMGFQRCWDMVQLALRDPEVVGAGNEWGHDRLKRLYYGIGRMQDYFFDAFTLSPEADYLQQKLDDALEEIWHEELSPFSERYEYVKQFGYEKGRKEWK